LKVLTNHKVYTPPIDSDYLSGLINQTIDFSPIFPKMPFFIDLKNKKTHVIKSESTGLKSKNNSKKTKSSGKLFNPKSDKKNRYRIENWYSRHGIEMDEKEENKYYRILTVDGIEIHLLHFSNAKNSNKAVLIVPDFGTEHYFGPKYILEELKKKFHLFLLFPRGHNPSRSYIYGQNVKKKFLNQKWAERFFWDLRASEKLIRLILANRGKKTISLGLVAGSYFSTISLWKMDAAHFQFFVFVSPYKVLYGEDQLPFYEKIKAPVLLVGGKGSGYHLQTIYKRIPNNNQSKIIIRPYHGRGYRLLYSLPGETNPILEYIKSI